MVNPNPVGIDQKYGDHPNQSEDFNRHYDSFVEKVAGWMVVKPNDLAEYFAWFHSSGGAKDLTEAQEEIADRLEDWTFKEFAECPGLDQDEMDAFIVSCM